MKPGYKTTEFWLSLAAILIAFTKAQDVVPGGFPSQIVEIAASALTAMGYTAARALQKSVTSKAKAIEAVGKSS